MVGGQRLKWKDRRVLHECPACAGGSLGTFWCIESDNFGFRIELRDKPLTRCRIISTVSSVYDPLGMAASVILVGKQILQDPCPDGVDWDDAVSENVHS